MEEDSGIALKALRVDGGAVQNALLMQFQSDLLGTSVERPDNLETTALGAAYLAGLAVGFWSSQEEISALWKVGPTYTPSGNTEHFEHLYTGWKKAVKAAMAFKND